MAWKSDTVNDAHTLVAGDCQCRVWPTSAVVWTAMVSRLGVAVAHDHFATLEDAQQWCAARLAELGVKDQLTT